jgi:anthranilate phosphoribosyltransferase
MANALHGSGVRRAFVIHGSQGWDEPTPIGPFTLFDVDAAGVRCEQRTPEDYGLARCTEAALAGGDAAYNALELKRALTGTAPSAHRDALLLGAALALQVTGRESAPRAAVARAAAAIDSGGAAQVLLRLQQFGDALPRSGSAA